MTAEQEHELQLWQGIVDCLQRDIDDCEDPQRIPGLLGHLAYNRGRLEEFRATLDR